MKKKAQRKSLVITAIGFFLFCIGLQCVWYYALESADARFVSPISGENTLIRIQRLSSLQDKNIDTVFMGSSITERFLSRGRCGTVAVSHSPYMTGIHLMRGNVTFPAGTVYVLESTNMMHPSENEITDRMNQPDFRLFKTNPVFSLAAKPINLLVSSIYCMLQSKHAGDEAPFDVPVTEPLDLSAVPELTAEEKERYKEYFEGIAELRRLGGKPVFIHYPRKLIYKRFDNNQMIACKIAKHLDMPVLNYNVPYWNDKLHFSDKFHLISRDPLTVRFMYTVARDAHACTEGQK